MKIPDNKVIIEISYDDPADAILATIFVNSVLMLALPQDYREWNNLYSLLPENAGDRKIIGRFKIETLGGK